MKTLVFHTLAEEMIWRLIKALFAIDNEYLGGETSIEYFKEIDLLM